MALDQLSNDDRQKLKQFMDAGLRVMQEVADLQDGLRDTAKNLSEEFEVKPALLMKALRVAYKSSLEQDRETVDTVENILQATGRL